MRSAPTAPSASARGARTDTDQPPTSDRHPVEPHIFTGRVLDADGRPCPDVVATLREPEARTASEAFPATARTDHDGRFRLANPTPAKAWRLALHGPQVPIGWRLLDVSSKRAVHDLGEFRMPPLTRVEGTVQFAGRNKEDVSPSITLARTDRILFDEPDLEGHVKADENGRFMVRAVGPGRHRLTITAPGFATHTTAFDVRAGAPKQLHIFMRRGAAVRGTIKDTSGNPIADARIFATCKVDGAQQHRQVARTDADGRFDISNLKIGEVALTIRTSKMYPQQLDISAAWQGAELDLSIVLEGPGLISGRVFGERVAGAKVVLRRDGVRIAEGVADHDGLFEVPRPNVYTDADGRGQLRAFAADRSAQSRPLDLTSQTSELELELVPNPVLDVTVVDDLGNPVPAATVEAQPLISSASLATAVVDNSGRARIPVEWWESAGCVLSVKHPQHVAVKAHIEDVSAPVHIVLQRTGRIEGSVRGIVKALRYQVEARTNDTKTRTATADSQGQFFIDDLAPGTYALHTHVYTHEDVLQGNQPTATVTVAAKETTNVEFPAPQIRALQGRVVSLSGTPGRCIISGVTTERVDRLGIAIFDGSPYTGGFLTHTTDDGRFSVRAAGSGSAQLVATTAGNISTEPFQISWGPTTTPSIVIELPSATVRGTFMAASVDPSATARIVLVDASSSGHPSAASGPHSPYSVEARLRSQSIPFEFEYVGAGTWWLRVLVGERISVQRKLVVRAGQHMLVGSIHEPENSVVATFRCDFDALETSDKLAIVVRRDGSYEQTLNVVPDAVAEPGLDGTPSFIRTGTASAELQPGRYTLAAGTVLTSSPASRIEDLRLSLRASERTDPVHITVHPDGTTSPHTVGFKPRGYGR